MPEAGSAARRSDLRDCALAFLELAQLTEYLTKTVAVLIEKKDKLEEIAYDDLERNKKQQEAQLSLLWLSHFIKHVEKIRDLNNQLQQDIVNTYNRTAQQDVRDAEAKARATAEPFQRWEDFKFETASVLKINVMKNLIVGTFPSPDGSFTLEGQGVLVVAMEHKDGYIFWPEDSDVLPIKITDRKEWTEEVTETEEPSLLDVIE